MKYFGALFSILIMLFAPLVAEAGYTGPSPKFTTVFVGTQTLAFRTTNAGSDSAGAQVAGFQGSATGSTLQIAATATTGALNFVTANASGNKIRGAQLISTMTTTTAGSEVQTFAISTMVGGAAVANRLAVGTDGSVAIQGTGTSDSASAGFVGEYMENAKTASDLTITNVTSAHYFTCDSAASVSGGTTTGSTGIVLTAGDWDVTGTFTFRIETNALTALSTLRAFVGTVEGDDSTGFGYAGTATELHSFNQLTSGTDYILTLPTVRKSLNGTVTYFLKGYAVYTNSGSSVLGCRGLLRARRVR